MLTKVLEWILKLYREMILNALPQKGIKAFSVMAELIWCSQLG
jgi:hypothetical protein